MATYKVKQGDNLTKIAKANNTTVDALVKANNIANKNNIVAGSTLKIPGLTNNPVATPTTTTPKAVTTNNKTQPKATTPVATIQKYEQNTPTYQQSDALKNAMNALQQLEGNKPGAYNSNYQGQIDQILSKIMNREKFNYDFNADPIYQQYKDQYMNAGNMAMQDTMGNAAALTGGYGSSYATTAGNQAYQQNLQGLNNVIPELYQAAYSMYMDEGNNLNSQLGIYQGLDESNYARYMDGYNDYLNQLNYASNKANTMYDKEYNQYINNLNAWQDNRNYGYNKDQDNLAQSNYMNEFAYKQTQDNLAQSNYLNEFAYQKQQDKLAQDNFLKEFAYRQAQDSLAQQNKSLKSSGSTLSSGPTLKGSAQQSGLKTTTNQSNNYMSKISNLAKGKGLNTAVEEIYKLYNQGKITQDDVKILYVAAEGFAQHKVTSPTSTTKKSTSTGGSGKSNQKSLLN